MSYDYDLRAPLLRRGPRRRSLKPQITKDDIERCFDEWDSLPFQHALEQGLLDRAWQLLFDSAEQVLCYQSPEAIPRSADWQPVLPTCTVAGKRPERSAGLRALLKLQGRLLVAAQRPQDVALLSRITRSVRAVRQLVPELPFFDVIDDALLQQVKALVETYVQQEGAAAKARWRDRTHTDGSTAPRFVKRRADQVIAP